ncbi:MFS transporter [Caballeronia mineralivorans PML1(12)]|uniref:MFS transporter n=1 Tax=Caballeronia mineralivorans PML1(12) TaxID=908627 RepID=A0A0J1CZ58_9BURK|nr:MFS transporter [Caballeronia mineralivorans]KLU25842.1 MFS transporter [Caballeronia mineralivorans PML1(12)]
MKQSIYWVMALAAGLVVANNYYNQPLLVDFAHTFRVTEGQAGVISVAAQAGYALGLLFFIPLGDKVELRKLFAFTLTASVVALVAMAAAPTLPWAVAASFAAGMASVAPQLLTPLAAQIAGPQGRGKAVGIVMLGLLCGILVSRTVSGVIAAYFGWRAVYAFAAVAMVAVAAMLARVLPRVEPTFSGSYGVLMRSLFVLLREEPVVRQTASIAALQFAAFSAFWTTLAFHLHGLDPRYGSETAGLFGLVGVAGASASYAVGKLVDAHDPRRVILAASIVFIASYGLLAWKGASIGGLIVGVILLDLGLQSSHVSNMARNLAVRSTAMSRANTLYMTIRFAGGAIGATLGNYAWSVWHWAGVCCVGIVFAGASMLLQITPASSRRRPVAKSDKSVDHEAREAR